MLDAKMRRIILAAALLLFAACHLSAQHYQVLHSFSGYPDDAAFSVSRLVMDEHGNLYGTSPGGGAGEGGYCYGEGCGTVFELSPNGNGGWAASVLYSFCSIYNNGLCLDGGSSDAGLIIDSAGNLYGTTVGGGAQNNTVCENSGAAGCGTVFKVSPPAIPGGTWSESVLYSFCADEANGTCLDGWSPQAPVTLDYEGNLYGTADGGGGHESAGVVFELSPGADGWNETVLYNFCSLGQGAACPDGDFPYLAGVTFDKSGNLYGTTFDGGTKDTAGEGVVYRLSPGSGTWKESVLTVFPLPGQLYGYPSGGVTFDPAGNLYGSFEGPNGGVFRLNRKSGKRNFFAFNGSDGEQPIGGVTLDPKHGVLYGTNSGASGGTGNIYQIDAQGKETVLYQFCSQPNCADGYLPWATLIMDKSGNLYGTTEFGGEYGQGVVFELTP
jgi:uncharacterized repeat protein (TIGR03803 family)